MNTQYGDAIYRSWLGPLRFSGSSEGRIILSVPTRFMREWITSNYIEDIRSLWQEEQASEGYVIEIIGIEVKSRYLYHYQLLLLTDTLD